MRKAAIAFLLLVGLASAAAEAQGITSRIKGLWASPQLVGTAMTTPRRLAPDSLESEVWVFSTTLGRELYRVRFVSSDLARANEQITVGCTLRVWKADSIVVDGLQVFVANTWKAKASKNTDQTEFMRAYRSQILAYGLRGSPKLLAEAFEGNEFVLAQLSEELAVLQKTIEPLVEPPTVDVK